MNDQTTDRPMSENSQKKTKLEMLEEGLPQFEQFIESRESYIKALETTIDALRRENLSASKNNIAIRSSIDELVAMQRMSNTISIASEPDNIVHALMELTRQVIPVLDSGIFLFDSKAGKLLSLANNPSSRLQVEAEHQLEAGIVDWVIAEKKTVVIPDLDHMVSNASTRNFVIVPLILRSEGIGIYIIHTEKAQQEFSNQDIQLLSVLANQAAVGVEHWRTYRQLTSANEEIKSSHAQMMQAAKLAAIGELAAGIAHEIKNPLGVLSLHLDLAQMGRPLPNWIEMFSTQVKRLSDITLRLMNFARNASEDVTMEPVMINKVIEDTVAIVQHEFRGQGIEFALNLSADLMPVGGNANYLQQVFLNLIINARDAMRSGGRIAIDTSASGQNICIRFGDTGSGIPQEIREKIFQPFFTTKGDKGTGLGLAICNKIIAQHKGTIQVKCGKECGTEFTILLPMWRGGR
ncbi:MAG TPA: ATP-binding protein [Bacteroidota bacterium]|nr:ATP-binding protein [Bacteroidota bacterium]